MADILDVKPELPQEDPEHVRQMIAKAEGQTEEVQQEEPERLLAGKYKTEEDLIKGIIEVIKRQNEGKDLEAIYKELESGLGRRPAKGAKDEESKSKSEVDKAVEEAKEPLQRFNLDFDEFSKELSETGELSEASYERLEKAGIPREVVDTYLDGLRALAQQQFQEIYNIVGGEENYRSMIEWASENLTDDEREAFNATINSGLSQAKLAVEALHARYMRENAQPPKNLVHGSTSPNTGEVYQSLAQVVRDMNDPRYATDPAFRKQVQDKIARSNIL